MTLCSSVDELSAFLREELDVKEVATPMKKSPSSNQLPELEDGWRMAIFFMKCS